MPTLSQQTTTMSLEKATKNGISFNAESLPDSHGKVSMEEYVAQLVYNLNQRNERKQLVICQSDIIVRRFFSNDKKPAEGFMYLGDIIFTSGNDDEGHDEYWYPLSHAALLLVMTYKIINKKRFAITYNDSNTKGSKSEKELKVFAKAVKDWVNANPEKAQELCKNVVMED
jgi:hypothetical protein